MCGNLFLCEKLSTFRTPSTFAILDGHERLTPYFRGQKVSLSYYSAQAPFPEKNTKHNIYTSHHAGIPKRIVTSLWFVAADEMLQYGLKKTVLWLDRYSTHKGKTGFPWISCVLWTCHLSPCADAAYRLQPKDLHRRGYPGNSDDPNVFQFLNSWVSFYNSIMQKPHVFPEHPYPPISSPTQFSLLQHTQCFEFNHLLQLEVHHFCMGRILKSWGCHPQNPAVTKTNLFSDISGSKQKNPPGKMKPSTPRLSFVHPAPYGEKDGTNNPWKSQLDWRHLSCFTNLQKRRWFAKFHRSQRNTLYVNSLYVQKVGIQMVQSQFWNVEHLAYRKGSQLLQVIRAHWCNTCIHVSYLCCFHLDLPSIELFPLT